MPANRIVLAGASKYFSAMFNNNMREKTESKIPVGEVDGVTLRALVNYCYSGKIMITAENVQKILSAANMMLFDQIKNECVKHLTEQLAVKPDLSLSIFIIADKLSFNTLAKNSFEMISKHLGSVVNNEMFCHIEYSLLQRILESDAEFDIIEEEIYEAAMKWVEFDEENRKKLIPDILQLIRLIYIDHSVISLLLLDIYTH